MRKVLENLGISLTTSLPHIPQSHGLAERMNRKLLDKARTMMHHAGLQEEFWAEPIKHEADLRNQTTTL